MAGEIKRMLDTIIRERSKGDRILANLTITKLVLKGLDPERFDAASPDDPQIVERVRKVALELGVSLKERA